MGRRIVMVVFSLALMVALGGCGSGQSTAKITEATDSGQQTAGSERQEVSSEPEIEPSRQEEAEPDLSAVYSAYLKILQGDKDGIAAYNWQIDSTGMAAAPKPVAVCDITGDETPELLYLTVPLVDGHRGYDAYLFIYTFEDGGAKQIFSESFDVQAGGGVRYCLFTSGSDHQFYIYKSTGDETWTYSFTRYAPDSDGNLAAEQALTHQKSPSADYSSAIHSYAQDGTELIKSEYEAKTNGIISKMGSVLIGSGKEDQPIWEKAAKADSLAMSCPEAVMFLGGNPGESAADKPFTQEDALAYLAPRIAETWEGYIPAEAIPENIDYEKIAVSNKTVDGSPIYFIRYGIYRIGGGTTLVFADGSIIDSWNPDFKSYKDYFDFDIMAES